MYLCEHACVTCYRVSGSGGSSPATVGDTNRPSAVRPEDLAAAEDADAASGSAVRS